jgi:hypothetical protein
MATVLPNHPLDFAIPLKGVMLRLSTRPGHLAPTEEDRDGTIPRIGCPRRELHAQRAQRIGQGSSTRRGGDQRQGAGGISQAAAGPTAPMRGRGRVERRLGRVVFKAPRHHIHGSADRLVPLRLVRPAQVVHGGGHLLSLTHPVRFASGERRNVMLLPCGLSRGLPQHGFRRGRACRQGHRC